MTEPVFLFGSFREDEVQKYPTSILGSTKPKKKSSRLNPAVTENGFHNAHDHSLELKSSLKLGSLKGSAAGQNGLSSAPKGVHITDSRVVSNGKQPESASRSSRPAGKKSPAATSSAGKGVQKPGKQDEVKPSVENVHNAGNHASSIVKDFVADNGDQTAGTPLNSRDVSSSKVPEANGQGAPYAVVTPLRQSSTLARKLRGTGTGASQSPKVPQRNSEVDESPWEKEGADETLPKTTSEGDSEALASQFMPKSWAALVGVSPDAWEVLGPSGSTRRKSRDDQKRHPGLPQNQVAAVTALSGVSWLTSLREADAAGRRLLPRGLVNTGNSCFLNSTMQAMLSCSPFTHLLQVLKARGIPQLGYPTLRAWIDFFGEFEPSPDLNALKPPGRREADGRIPSVEVGRPFVPAMFDPVLQSFTPNQPSRAKGRNRQEDAQEFLSFVMDRMHEEILRLENKDSPVLQACPAVMSSEDEDWETVGPKNRTAVTRTHTFSESAVTDIFGGQLRSVVKTKGNKASATVQPFLLLHLDILPEFVHSVEDALRMFAAPESLEGYKPAAGKVGEVVTASKSVKIQTLPRVLILHLMRFSYGSGGSSKLHKHVQFPLEVTLGRELLASPTGSGNEHRRYELVATVSHHGKDPSVGHYTADSKQANRHWLRFDDGSVSAVSVSRVLQEQVYVLFYKRLGV